MKKTLAFMLILLITAGSLTGFTAKEIVTQGKDVRFTLETEKGDRRFLEGISADLNYSHYGYLKWDTEFDPQGEANTEVSFIKTGEDYYNERKYSGLSALYADIYDLIHKNPELKELLGNIKSETINVGDKNTYTVKLSDYFDYYPIYINLDLPDISVSWFSLNPFDEQGKYQYSGILPERADNFIEALEEYLKIPVYEEEIHTYTIEKFDTFSYSYGTEYTSTFNFNPQSAIFPDKLYFTINNRTECFNEEESVVLDTSEIPGGYGIYSVPYGNGDIKYYELKTEYSIAPDSTVIYFSGDAEKDIFYLCLRENEKFIFKIIDRKTMTDISAIELYDFSDNDRVYYNQYDDFFLFYKNEKELKVVKCEEDGTYKEALSVIVSEDSDINWEYFPYNTDCAFDGQRLIIFTLERNEYSDELHDSLNSEIFVFTKDGLGYYGKWNCSLGEKIDFRYVTFCQFYGYDVKIE